MVGLGCSVRGYEIRTSISHGHLEIPKVPSPFLTAQPTLGAQNPPLLRSAGRGPGPGGEGGAPEPGAEGARRGEAVGQGASAEQSSGGMGGRRKRGCYSHLLKGICFCCFPVFVLFGSPSFWFCLKGICFFLFSPAFVFSGIYHYRKQLLIFSRRGKGKWKASRKSAQEPAQGCASLHVGDVRLGPVVPFYPRKPGWLEGCRTWMEPLTESRRFPRTVLGGALGGGCGGLWLGWEEGEEQSQL